MLENTQRFGYKIDSDNKTIMLTPCPEDVPVGLGYTLVFQPLNDMIVESVEE